MGGWGRWVGQVGEAGRWSWWVGLVGGAGGLVQYVNRRTAFLCKIIFNGLAQKSIKSCNYQIMHFVIANNFERRAK